MSNSDELAPVCERCGLPLVYERTVLGTQSKHVGSLCALCGDAGAKREFLGDPRYQVASSREWLLKIILKVAQGDAIAGQSLVSALGSSWPLRNTPLGDLTRLIESIPKSDSISISGSSVSTG